MKPIKNQGCTQVLRKGKHFLLFLWHIPCYPCYNPDDKLCMRKELDCDYDKWDRSVVICDIDIPQQLTKSW